jgi:hypothetical protein
MASARKLGLSVTQEIRVAADSPVAGTVVSFPPSSLAADIEITVEEAASIATATTTSQLGIGENISSSGTAVAIFAKEDAEPVQPYGITLALPPAPTLSLQEAPTTLVVFYKIKAVAKNKILLGLIPFANLKLDGTSVSFAAGHFGAFQAVYTKNLVNEAKEVTATTPIQTKREASEFAPFAVTSRQPFVVGAGDLVTVTGTGFRSTMGMALGGTKVLALKVASEESATFLAPIQSRFGITDLTASQDGIEQTVTLLYRGVKTDLPIITLTEPEVCSDYQYYDIDGALKTGTRGCNPAAALTSIYGDASWAAIPHPNCWRDGQTDCLTTERYRSADTDSSAISSWDIRQGKTLGGIKGGLKFCSPSTGLPMVGETLSSSLTGAEKADGGDDGNIEAPQPEEELFRSDETCSPSVWQAGGIDSGSSVGFCNDAEDQCTYKDILTGLTWSETASPIAWPDALAACSGTISGYGDWRLPTVKELIQAAFNGIEAVHSKSFSTGLSGANYWSATPKPSSTDQAWSVNLADGNAKSAAKSSLQFSTCVRP